jgi:hypothetical protein
MGPPNFKYDTFITGVNLELLNFLWFLLIYHINSLQ